MTAADQPLTVLILAGGSLSEKQLGPAPCLNSQPADLADGSGLARDRIIRHYRRQSEHLQIRLLIDRGAQTPRPHLSDGLMEPLCIDPQPSVIESVRTALEQIATPWLLLIPVTTLPSGPATADHRIELGDTALPRENWSAVSAPNSATPVFHNKTAPPSSGEPPSHPFTGVICARTSTIAALLREPMNHNDSSDLLVLAERLYRCTKTRFHFSPWHDLGHRATYSSSRLSRLSSRSFNRVVYEPEGDLIRKGSSNPERLQQEHLYLKHLPQSVRRYFPALVSPDLTRDQKGDLSMELDYVPFPNLAELFLHWRIGINGWEQIARRLALIRSALQQSDGTTTTRHQADLGWLYSKKLQQRLQQLAIDPPESKGVVGLGWYQFWDNSLTLELCGAQDTVRLTLPSPQQCCSVLMEELAAFESTRPLARIHGDLCFNNILAEPLSGSIRLIDPRGERPPGSTWPVGYGDPRYDLVKLLHSSRYLYDVVVNGLFRLECVNTTVQLQLDVPAQQSIADQAIRRHLVRDQLTAEEERLLTASLFFSMLPLHRSEPKHCLAFACIGALIIERQFDSVLSQGIHRAQNRSDPSSRSRSSL